MSEGPLKRIKPQVNPLYWMCRMIKRQPDLALNFFKMYLSKEDILNLSAVVKRIFKFLFEKKELDLAHYSNAQLNNTHSSMIIFFATYNFNREELRALALQSCKKSYLTILDNLIRRNDVDFTLMFRHAFNPQVCLRILSWAEEEKQKLYLTSNLAWISMTLQWNNFHLFYKLMNHLVVNETLSSQIVCEVAKRIASHQTQMLEFFVKFIKTKNEFLSLFLVDIKHNNSDLFDRSCVALGVSLNTPLHECLQEVAQHYGIKVVLTLLLDRQPLSWMYVGSFIKALVKRGLWSTVTYLVKNTPDAVVTMSSNYILRKAIKYEKKDLVKYLLQHDQVKISLNVYFSYPYKVR